MSFIETVDRNKMCLYFMDYLMALTDFLFIADFSIHDIAGIYICVQLDMIFMTPSIYLSFSAAIDGLPFFDRIIKMNGKHLFLCPVLSKNMLSLKKKSNK